MARRFTALALTVGTLVACSSAGDARSDAETGGPSRPPTARQPTAAAAHLQLEFEDRSRPAVDPGGDRSAPTRRLTTELYLPAGRGRHPLVVFAHGSNGDPSKFTELFAAWAEAGFAVLAPRFPITATSVPPGPVARVGDIVEQPADMSFVLDELLAGEHRARIDRDRIGVAGLSLGGGTVWALTTDTCCVDPRFRAAIVMDGHRLAFGDATYTPNTIPVLVYHADADPALPFADARRAYGRLVGPKYFVTIFGIEHAAPFENTPTKSDPMVVTSSLDFWRAYLLDDRAARRRIVVDATVAGVSTAEAHTTAGSTSSPTRD